MLIVTLLLAQQFSPNVPGAPAVEGPVTERAVLRSVDVKIGTGLPALPGQEYTVHYTGWLRDGKKFDSSVDRQEPFKFVQGRRQVIAGFDSGYEGMRVGGKRRLYLPYQLAYGEKGRGAIPPRAELIFDVELLAVRDVPDEKPSVGLLTALGEYERKILALARAIPEEKYGTAPGPGVRTVSEVLAHLAVGQRLMLELAVKLPPREEFRAKVMAAEKREREVRAKAECIALLEEMFAQARRQIEPLRAAELAREWEMPESAGVRTTVHGAYTMFIAHTAEHLGQLIAYARLMGVSPPWSQ
jgi:uncharacterized damage-inducible protein DinB